MNPFSKRIHQIKNPDLDLSKGTRNPFLDLKSVFGFTERNTPFMLSVTSSGVCQFWKKRKQWSTSPTITWSPWRWSFSKHTKWERRRKSIDQNSRLFLFYRAFYLPFYLSRYYELGSTLRTGSNHSCAIVLRLSRAALRTHCVCNQYIANR